MGRESGDYFLEYSDDHLSGCDQDELGRAEGAQKLADYLFVRASQTTSTVTGITGPWGSGKSSYVKFMCERLNETLDLSVVTFNPWAESGPGGVTRGFFGAVLSALRARGRTKGRFDFAGLSDLLIKFEKEILLSNSLILGSHLGGKFASYLIESARKKNSQDSIFSQIVKHLSKLQQPLFVVVDDVDRLHGQDLFDIFRLVRAIARFPNFHFILIYDKAHVTRELAKEITNPNEYLSKIVQLEVVLNVIEGDRWRQFVSDKLFNWAVGRGLSSYVRGGNWWTVLHGVILPIVKTPRDLKRLLFALDHLFQASELEFDVLDVVSFEAIRNSLPEIWEEISNNRLYFTLGGPASLAITNEMRKGKALQLKMRFPDSENLVDVILSDVLEYNPLRNHAYPKRADVENLLTSRRLLHSSVFESYLMRGENTEIASISIAEGIIAIQGGPKFHEVALSALDTKQRKFVYSSIASRALTISQPKSIDIAVAMVEALQTFTPYDVGFLDQYDPKQSTRRFLNSYLDSALSETSSRTFVTNCINACNTLSSKWFVISCVSNPDAIVKLGQDFHEHQRKTILKGLESLNQIDIKQESAFYSLLYSATEAGIDCSSFLNSSGFAQTLKTATYTSTGTNGVKLELHWDGILKIFRDPVLIEKFAHELLLSGEEENVQLGGLALRYLRGEVESLSFD